MSSPLKLCIYICMKIMLQSHMTCLYELFGPEFIHSSHWLDCMYCMIHEETWWRLGSACLCIHCILTLDSHTFDVILKISPFPSNMPANVWISFCKTSYSRSRQMNPLHCQGMGVFFSDILHYIMFLSCCGIYIHFIANCWNNYENINFWFSRKYALDDWVMYVMNVH